METSRKMTRLVVFLYLFLAKWTAASTITCPDLDHTASLGQYNVAYVCEMKAWSATLSDWKLLIEKECDISDSYWHWQQLFECPDYYGVTCKNPGAFHSELDAFNCNVTTCTDGLYTYHSDVWNKWKKHFSGYKKIMEYYKMELKHCRMRDCPEMTTQEMHAITTTPMMSTKVMDQSEVTTKLPRTPVTETEPTTTISSSAAGYACNSPAFDFRKKNHMGYVQYNGSISNMTSFTACVWVMPPENGTVKGVVFSYCAAGTPFCNTFGAEFSNALISTYGQISSSMNISLPTARSHYCISMSEDERKVHYYINGTNVTEFEHAPVVIPGGGVLILGQDQDGSISGSTPGPPGNADDGFFGRLDGFLLWDRAISAEEVQGLYESGCNCATDAIVAFDSANSIVVEEEVVHADLEKRC